jgi:DNA-directed RNA polymerase subunit RPC12/RpoP
MDIERCSNKDCGRPFEVSQIGGQLPGTKEPEEICCPYCGHTIKRMSNGVWRTQALSPEREAQYNREHPGQKLDA